MQTVETPPEVKRLQEAVDSRLGLTSLSDSKRFSATGGQLLRANKDAADRILAKFDTENLPRLLSESKKLSGGSGVVTDSAVPAIYERTVIRESLYSMRALDLMDVGEQDFGASISIPYSYRDTSAAGRNDTRTYEGQEIQRAGIIQAAETTFPIPQKLAFLVSDELQHLSSARTINWDVAQENVCNASRIIAEDTDRLAFNEILHSSDEYGAQEVINEDLEPQADDTKTIFVLANFPVVRPRVIYDLQGVQVGSITNPITVSYNSIELSEYDHTGTQAAGTYFVLDCNMGEIYLVDESGAVQVPANSIPYTISYSYASNVYQFDVDIGSNEIDEHWDKFLYRYALRKSEIEDQRYHHASFGLMSGNAMSQIEQAKKFSANYKLPGTNLTLEGDLGQIKGVPNYKTAGPGLWIGDQRVLIGEKGVTRYRVLKPWLMGSLENQRGPNGRFTGQKEAYGDQFVALHTPTQLKKAYTSIALYSSSGRVAR